MSTFTALTGWSVLCMNTSAKFYGFKVLGFYREKPEAFRSANLLNHHRTREQLEAEQVYIIVETRCTFFLPEANEIRQDFLLSVSKDKAQRKEYEAKMNEAHNDNS